MNREDVIRWMQEVGAKESNPIPQTYDGFVDIFQQFAALVSAAEREACAKVCDDLEAELRVIAGDGWYFAKAKIAAATIRARGEVPK